MNEREPHQLHFAFLSSSAMSCWADGVKKINYHQNFRRELAMQINNKKHLSKLGSTINWRFPYLTLN